MHTHSPLLSIAHNSVWMNFKANNTIFPPKVHVIAFLMISHKTLYTSRAPGEISISKVQVFGYLQHKRRWILTRNIVAFTGLRHIMTKKIHWKMSRVPVGSLSKEPLWLKPKLTVLYIAWDGKLKHKKHEEKSRFHFYLSVCVCVCVYWPPRLPHTYQKHTGLYNCLPPSYNVNDYAVQIFGRIRHSLYMLHCATFCVVRVIFVILNGFQIKNFVHFHFNSGILNCFYVSVVARSFDWNWFLDMLLV